MPTWLLEMYKFWGSTDRELLSKIRIDVIHVKAGTMEGIFVMKKWRSIAAGMGCLSMLFTTGTVPVSASDEITEIPEQSIVYWSMCGRG